MYNLMTYAQVTLILWESWIADLHVKRSFSLFLRFCHCFVGPRKLWLIHSWDGSPEETHSTFHRSWYVYFKCFSLKHIMGYNRSLGSNNSAKLTVDFQPNLFTSICFPQMPSLDLVLHKFIVKPHFIIQNRKKKEKID